ncbi:hypothetical protein HYS92_03230 [Candidatus Daviesbacteria bacterium]|nr:hypothetical protein [Candidatus Daviesbacteria bacterium]
MHKIKSSFLLAIISSLLIHSCFFYAVNTNSVVYAGPSAGDAPNDADGAGGSSNDATGDASDGDYSDGGYDGGYAAGATDENTLAPPPKPIIRVLPSCDVITSFPKMAVGFTDPSLDNSYFEIIKTDGSPKQSGDGLRGTYFTTDKTPQGTPIITRLDQEINFNWETGTPDPAVSADGDHFSINWAGYVQAPQTGDYIFYTKVNGRAKLFIDGTQLINNGTDTGATYQTNKITLVAGSKHSLSLEFIEETGNSEIQLSWSYDTGNPSTSQVTPDIIKTQYLFSNNINYQIAYSSAQIPKTDPNGPQTPKSQPDGLQGYYFPNPDLTGAPILKRVDPKIKFDTWGAGSPDPLVPADDFSVRWSGQILVPDTTTDYTFYVKANDGAKLFIDGVKVIDKWGNTSTTKEYISTPVKLAANTRHNIILEYYEHTGDAEVQLLWESPSLPKSVIPGDNLFSNGYLFNDSTALQPNTFYSYAIVRYRIEGTSYSSWSNYQLTPPCGAININPNPPVVSCTDQKPYVDLSWTTSDNSSSFSIWRSEASDTQGFNPDRGNSLTSGLVSYWNFDDQGQTTLKDNKDSNDGSIFGPIKTNSEVNLGRSFDGEDDYISISNNSSLNLTENFSISAWINLTDTSATNGVFTKLDDNNHIQYAFSVDNKKIRFEYSSDGQNFSLQGGEILNNKYYFVTVAVDNSLDINLFVNGQSVATGQGSASLPQLSSPINIGKFGGTMNKNFLKGTVDEVGFWSKALTGQEITDLFNNNSGNAYNPLNYANPQKIQSYVANLSYRDTPPDQTKRYSYQISGLDAQGNDVTFSNWASPVELKSCSPPVINLFLTSKGKTLGHNDYPLVIKQNDPVSISWNTVNVPVSPSSCTASIPSTDPAPSAALTSAWSNGKAETGNQALPPISTIGNYQFSLTCSNPQGVSGSSTITLKVEQTLKPYFKTTGGDVHTNKGIYISE